MLLQYDFQLGLLIIIEVESAAVTDVIRIDRIPVLEALTISVVTYCKDGHEKTFDHLGIPNVQILPRLRRAHLTERSEIEMDVQLGYLWRRIDEFYVRLQGQGR